VESFPSLAGRALRTTFPKSRIWAEPSVSVDTSHHVNPVRMSIFWPETEGYAPAREECTNAVGSAGIV
jgi:hypothetical protein